MSWGNPVSSVRTLDLCEQMSILRAADGTAKDGSDDGERRRPREARAVAIAARFDRGPGSCEDALSMVVIWPRHQFVYAKSCLGPREGRRLGDCRRSVSAFFSEKIFPTLGKLSDVPDCRRSGCPRVAPRTRPEQACRRPWLRAIAASQVVGRVWWVGVFVDSFWARTMSEVFGGRLGKKRAEKAPSSAIRRTATTE
jgi:hypothetical protein